MSTTTTRPSGWVPWGAVGLAAAFALFFVCASGNFLVSDTVAEPGYAKAGYALAILGFALGFGLVAASGLAGREDQARAKAVLRLQLIAFATLAIGWMAGVVVAAIGAAAGGELGDGKWAPILPLGLIPLLVLLLVGRYIRRRLEMPKPVSRRLN